MATSDRPFPRVPAYAWTWLQRSRPVVHEAAVRLTGEPPTAGFLDDLRERFEVDAFTCQVVVDVVAEVAFGGRVPSNRPAHASWDRGLTWWAAALAGVPVERFEGPAAPGGAPRLFDPGPAEPPPPTGRRSRPGSAAVQRERRALAAALRQLLDANTGDQVPASAVRQLLAHLEGN